MPEQPEQAAQTATQEQAHELSFQGMTEYANYTRGRRHTVNGVFHIEAPMYEGEGAARSAVDMIAVIDTSGSMSGSKLELAKATLEFLVKNLTQADRMGLVVYNSDIHVAFPPTKMDAEGKRTAKAAISHLRAQKCTNLSGGLFKGVELMQRRSSPASVASVLLMTDGIANEGVRGDALITSTRQLLGDNPDYTLYTFGYGSNVEEELLKNLSEVGNGMYYYIENNDVVPEAFGDCLGGLLSVVGQNVKVSIATDNGAKITRIHTTQRQTVSSDRTTAEVTLGDIQVEEQRDLLVELDVPALTPPDKNTLARKKEQQHEQEAEQGGDDKAADAARNMETDDDDGNDDDNGDGNDGADAGRAAEQPQEDAPAEHMVYATGTLEYVNVIRGSFATATTELTFARPTTAARGEAPNENVRRQARRVEAAEAMRRAMDAARAGDYTTASATITSSCTGMQQEAKRDSYIQGLCTDMQECMDNVGSARAFNQHGKHRAMNLMQMHSRQRGVSAESAYTTNSRFAMRAKAKGDGLFDRFFKKK